MSDKSNSESRTRDFQRQRGTVLPAHPMCYPCCIHHRQGSWCLFSSGKKWSCDAEFTLQRLGLALDCCVGTTKGAIKVTRRYVANVFQISRRHILCLFIFRVSEQIIAQTISVVLCIFNATHDERYLELTLMQNHILTH